MNEVSSFGSYKTGNFAICTGHHTYDSAGETEIEYKIFTAQLRGKHEFQVSEEYSKIILKSIPEQKLDGTVSGPYPLNGHDNPALDVPFILQRVMHLVNCLFPGNDCKVTDA
jgi:hypothetical protein